MKFKGKVKGDLLLIVVIVIIGGIALLYNQVVAPQKGVATVAIVEVEGEIVHKFDLSQDTVMRFDLDTGYNVVEVKDGRVRVSDADCPDLLCVNTGWRQHVGQVIVCMPHHFVVKIAGDEGSLPELDGFTY